MKSIFYIIYFFLLVACTSKELTFERDCEQVNYSQISGSFKIVSHVVFDTTANLFHATVVDYTTGEPLISSKLHFDQNQLIKEILTDENGKAQIFENGFSGIWQLTISHVNYRCLIVKDIEIGGGQHVIIKLKHT